MAENNQQFVEKKWHWIRQLEQLGESPPKERATAAKRIMKAIESKDPEIAVDKDIQTMLTDLCSNDSDKISKTSKLDSDEHSVEWVTTGLSRYLEPCLQELPIIGGFDHCCWLPDWKDDSAYAYLDNASLTQWAWEFLRRNPDYQIDYHKFSVYANRPRAMVGESYYDYADRMKTESKWSSPPSQLEEEISKKYDISPRPCDPIIDTPANFFIGQNRSGAAPWIQFGDDYPSIPSENHVVVVFDITQPLPAQIANAELMLREWIPATGSELQEAPRKRVRSDKFLDYLRVLDADQAGADLNTIANALLPDVDNDYPDKKAEKKLRANLKRAKSIQENEYRNLFMKK